MKQRYTFVAGKMNKDADERLVPEGHYIDAHNVRITSTDGGDMGAVKKFKGTTAIETLPSFSAELGITEYKNVIYVFYLDSSNNTVLYKHDLATSTGSTLMSLPLGNTSADAPFEMYFVDDDDADRLLLYWNDRRNELQKVNIRNLESDASHYATSSDIEISKPSYLLPPTVVGSDSGNGINKIKDKNFRFAYRWIYEDGETSPLTPFSGLGFSKIDYVYDHVLGVFFQDTSSGNVYYKYSDDGASTLYGFFPLLNGVTAGETFFATSAYFGVNPNPYAAVMGTVSGDSTFEDSDGLNIDMYADAYPFDENKQRIWMNIPRETNSVLIAGSYFDANYYPVIWKLNRENSRFDASYIDSSFSFNHTSGYGWTGLASSEYGDIIFASYQKASGEPTKVLASSDGGANYSEIHDTTSAYTSALGCNVNGRVAYLSTIKDNGSSGQMEIDFYKCTDVTTFTKCSTTTVYLDGSPTNNYSSKIYTSSDGNIVYLIIAATDGVGTVNYLLRSIDSGKTFQQIGGNGTEGLNRDGVTTNFDPIKRLSVNTFGNIVQWNVDNSIYSSSDFGDTITEIQSSINSGTIEPIGLESAQPDEIKGRDIIENAYNQLTVSLNSGNKHVLEVELYAQERSEGNFTLIKKWDKAPDRDNISDNSTINFIFKNDGIYQTFSTIQANRLFDNIPKKQETFDIVENRIVAANYTDGNTLDFTPNAGTIVELDSSVYSDSDYFTLKTDTIQSYGILYKDAKGRPFSVYPIGDIDVPHWADVNYQVFKAKVTIAHEPPTGAAYYSIVRKKPLFDYDVVYRFPDVESRDGKIYLLLPPDVNAEAGYSLTYSGDGLNFANIRTEFSITEVIDNSAQSQDLNLSEGKWIVINDTSLEGFSVSDVVNGLSEYLKGSFYVSKQFSTEADVVYYETPYSFPITGGYHTGNTQTQTAVQDAIIDLDNDFDTVIKKYPYREEYKYSPLISISTLGRGWLESDEIKEVTRYSSMCWSDIYVYDNNYNGLSFFSPDKTKTLPTKHGGINKIHYNYSDILSVQDDIVARVLVNKYVQYGADGSGTQGETNAFLGTYIPIPTLNGSTSTESFSFWGNYVFYADKKRGKVSLISSDGHSLISDDGMSAYFRNVLKNETGKIYATYNPQVNSFMLTLPSQNSTILYEPQKGWSCFQDFEVKIGANDGYFMYSVFDGNIHKHDANSTLNIFYGDVEEASIEFSANEGSAAMKVYAAMMLEGNGEWDAEITNSEQITTIDDFEKREGFWYAAMPMAISTEDYDDSFATNGIGICSDYTAGVITTDVMPVQSVGVNDVIWGINGGTPYQIGTATNIDHSTKKVTISTVVTPPSVGDFIYSRKTSYIEGDMIRDYYAKVKLTHSGSNAVELFAVNLEVKQSKQ